ncbi:hypothetical protein JQ604_25450 [Bradyrhizobium jicamae]|uniref:cysteine rich repeat-containing protein n=1 Tax=Bradyrhizobium jicamae TaxID=280332 RepID=UPI001BAB2C31|nr:cysteine rich repeat-containing protein [Bradyrhizobium jicamae]MBR0755540.1 hypothetical protein [Bradyrhizobium jicamae]
MPAQRIALGLAITIGGTAAAMTPVLSQEYRGTWEQQMACTPDVWRLCSDQVPDVGRIVACLRQNTPQLSNGCRAVFESNASAQQQAPVGRGQQPSMRQPSMRPSATQPAPVAPPPRSYDEDD